jgi:uncharacterized membrane protein (TIGR02234 family)
MAERDRRGLFAPLVLVGLASAALTAVSAARTWISATGDAAGVTVATRVSGSDAAPLALALSLVALAAWGVLLVGRTGSRRVAAVLGLVACAGALVVSATLDSHEVAREALADKGAQQVASLGHVGWYWVMRAAGIVQAATFLIALRRLPAWPTMSSRYDAPSAPAEPKSETDVWKALDEGHDPTDPSDPAGPSAP